MDDITLSSLTKEQRFFLMELFARGYTARTIGKKLLEKFELVVSDAVILQGAVLYADDIDAYRKEIGKLAINAGLARKEERVRRLGELAEDWEDEARKPGNPKAAGVYMRALDQIREETEPLGLIVQVDKDDPWTQLLQKLAQSRTLPTPELPVPTETNLIQSSQSLESQKLVPDNESLSNTLEDSSL